MRRFGCSYFPPATPMVSEGGDPKGSLVAVKVTLPQEQQDNFGRHILQLDCAERAANGASCTPGFSSRFTAPNSA